MKFIKKGCAWCATFDFFEIEFSENSMTVKNPKSITELLVRFETLLGLDENSFFYRESNLRCAVVLPMNQGHIVIMFKDNQLSIAQYINNDQLVQNIELYA